LGSIQDPLVAEAEPGRTAASLEGRLAERATISRTERALGEGGVEHALR
jgi:hypothetical protein